MAAFTKPRLNIGSASLRGTLTPETPLLWALVLLELLAHVGLRRYYRRQHGG